MQVTRILLLIGLFLTLYSCKKEQDKEIYYKNISGYIQKGPYINGSSVQILELNEIKEQTGKSYNLLCSNNNGYYEMRNIKLVSNYILVKSDGFFYNEITGVTSSNPLTLNVISDISENTSVNANVFTHLEKERIEYLLKNKFNFSTARDSTQKEVLSIFGISYKNIGISEEINIFDSTDASAMLLASSIILLGDRNVSELTEILANIISDIEEDGILNDEKIKSTLYNSTLNLNLQKIRTNLEKKFNGNNDPIYIPDFEKYIYSYLLFEKPFNINADIQNVSCNGLSDGKINITVNEGTPPFTYKWSNGETTKDISNLPAGNYSVSITDKNNYKMTKNNIVISEPMPLSISDSVMKPICESNNGSINITVSGGTEPYSILWSNGNNTEDINDILPGEYSVTITDQNQCSLNQQFSVKKEIPKMNINGTVTNISENEAYGSIDIEVSNGTEPYTYEWSNGEENEDINNLIAGNYTINIFDKNHCNVIAEYRVYNLIKDIDNNYYKTIGIGSQVWMAENLKTTRYNNGQAIQYIEADSIWNKNYSIGAYCYYENKQDNSLKYGNLYNWYAVNTGNLCPSGWHVSSKEDWQTLESYLVDNGYGYGGSGNDIAKSISSKTDWDTSKTVVGDIGYNIESNNSTGFSALPGGIRTDDFERYSGILQNSYWRTSTYQFGYWTIRLNNKENHIIMDDIYTERIGMYIRCVKDN